MTVLTLREPHGVTGRIVPWSYPMQIFGRSVEAALAAGDACVVKPAEDACLSVMRVAELAADVGFPPGALNIVTSWCDRLPRCPASGIDTFHLPGRPRRAPRSHRRLPRHRAQSRWSSGQVMPQIVFRRNLDDDVFPVVVSMVQNARSNLSSG